MNRGPRLVLFVGFAAGALFHLASLVDPTIGSPSPPWRHALFVVVNAFFAGAMVPARTPRWLVVPATFLIVQQGYGHGRDLGLAAASGHLDIQSLLALAALPLLAYVATRALRAP